MRDRPTASSYGAQPAGSVDDPGVLPGPKAVRPGCPSRVPGGLPGLQRVVVRYPGLRGGNSIGFEQMQSLLAVGQAPAGSLWERTREQ